MIPPKKFSEMAKNVVSEFSFVVSEWKKLHAGANIYV